MSKSREFMTIKKVVCEEMTRREYVESRGWILPESEKHLKNEPVFKVYYPNGYVSMCPRDTFLANGYEVKDNKIDIELVKKMVKSCKFSTKIMGDCKLVTIMEYELLNGMVGVESSACVDPKNYSAEIGEEILRNRIYEKIWFGLGFCLGLANIG